MSKTLRTAAIIVGAVALVATGVGAIAGSVAVGAAATGAASTAASVAATAATVASIATVAAAGLSIGAQLTAQPPPLGGSATKFKADKDAGLPYVVGRTATGGNIIYRRTHNTSGYALPDLQTFVVLLSCAGPVNAIESFSADRAAVSFSSGAATGAYAGWMWQTQQLGQSPESAALRVTPGGTLPPGWTTAAKMSGLAAAMWTLRYDQKGKFYAQGVPQPLWVLQGVKVYDPRLDSTYPGGSGSCRSNDETTFVYSENPYLHGLTWALGRYRNGKRVIGIGAPIAGIDVRAYVEGANVADANGWTIGGTVYSTDGKWAVLKTMLQGGAGRPMHLGAMLSCTVQTPRVALATVTTDDLIGEARVTATTSRRDRFNSIIPRYRSEAHNWEIIPAAPVTVAAHVTTDGGLRTRERDYAMVQDLDQVAALARYDIEDAREFGPIVLPLKLRWLGYRPGDCISVNLPEVGLNGQDILIGNREFDAAGLGVTLTARSETFAKHPFALGQTGVAPPTASVSIPAVPPQPGAVAWSLSGAGLVSGATVTPALIITGAAASVPIDAVVIEYRLWVSGQAADVGWIGNGAYLPDATRVEITAVLPSTAYEIAVSYRLGAFTGSRRIVGPVTTTAAGLEWSGVGGGGRPADGATRNVVTYSMAAPSSPVDGDLWVDLTGTYAVFKLRSGGAWVTGANALSVYNNLTGRPVALADINTTESSKLAGIENGATINDAGDFANRNGSFEFPLRPDGSIPGWTVVPGAYAGSATVIDYAADSFRGTRMARVDGQMAIFGDVFAVTSLERMWCRTRFGVAGATSYIEAFMRCFDKTGAFTDVYIDADPYATGNFYSRGIVEFLVPTGSVRAQLIFGVDLPSAPGVTGGVAFIDYFEASRSEFGATLGANRRNMGQVFGGGVQQVYDINPLTATNTAGVGSIAIAAHTVSDDLGTISYNSGSIGGLTPGATYGVIDVDPTFAGGARTYAVVTSAADLTVPGTRLLGYVTVPASSGGSAPGDSGGGAGGGYPGTGGLPLP